MNTKELNEYIENYLVNDKTQRAIMLTAPWGSGKSYYIKNELCDFLRKNNLKYAIVSLYGIESLKEINKELFLEIKLQKAHKKCKWLGAWGKTILTGTAVVGKTLLKHLANVDIDFNIKEPNYEKIYESIDLSNRLIIFEDLERSGVDIVEFLGYVNNLCEQDGVRVLLVANENEIVKSTNYSRIKEKTIGDTINFSSDYYESIKSILEKFDNKYFKLMLREQDDNGDLSLVRRIKQQMINENCINYRSLLYACQKTEDMLNLLDRNKEYDVEFIENLFIGTVIYSIKFNDGKEEYWEDISYTSSTLGNYAYPLYKVMYDYIKTQVFSVEDFEYMLKLFIKTKDISKADETLQVIYDWYEKSEKELGAAIDVVCKRLKSDEGIVHNEYVKLANYLISIKTVLKYDKIDECLKYMLLNTKKAVNNGEKIQVFSSTGIQLLSQKEIDEFEEFKLAMMDIVNNQQNKLKDFSYEPESLSNYYDWITGKKITFINEKGFANKLDINKTIEMLKKCSAKQINVFREILQYVYMEISNIAEFMHEDVKNLKALKIGVDKIISESDKIDAIQKLQLKWLSGNLETIIAKLQGGQNGKTK